MKLENSGKWNGVTDLEPTYMADVIGRRLLNNIDLASRRVPKKGDKKRKKEAQHESFTTVDTVDPEKFTLAALMRLEDAVRILEMRILGSNISLSLSRWSLITNAGKKNQRHHIALKIRASYGADLPLAEANLRPVRREYRRLVKARPEKV